MKKYIPLNIIREMQIKTTEIPPHPGDNGLHQQISMTSVGEVTEKKELCCTASGNVNWHSPFGRQ